MLKLYVQAGCVQCRATERWLNEHDKIDGRDYCKFNLDIYPALRQKLKTQGILTTPVIQCDSGESWTGFRPERLRAVF